MKEKDLEKKERFRKMWVLLFEDPETLSDAQIKFLLEEEEELRSLTYSVFVQFPERWKRVENYRNKKKELSRLSKEELKEKMERIMDHRSHILRTVSDDELSDSFFESPPLDSDENIIYELIKE